MTSPTVVTLYVCPNCNGASVLRGECDKSECFDGQKVATVFAPLPSAETRATVKEALELRVSSLRHKYELEAERMAIKAELGVGEWEAFMPQGYRDAQCALAELTAKGWGE
jgi:hypothetical protein